MTLQLLGDTGVQLVSGHVAQWIAIVLSMVILVLVAGITSGIITAVLQSQSQCATPGVYHLLLKSVCAMQL